MDGSWEIGGLDVDFPRSKTLTQQFANIFGPVILALNVLLPHTLRSQHAWSDGEAFLELVVLCGG